MSHFEVRKLYFPFFSQFSSTFRIDVPIDMLLVAHTDTDHQSVSFTHQQTDNQIDQASALV